MWTCVVLLVRWPCARWVADRVWLHRGQIVIGNWPPATRGLTEVLGWCCWWCDWNRWYWEWCQGCRLGQWHRGWWPRLHCWPGWYVCWSLLGCGQKVVRGAGRASLVVEVIGRKVCKYSSSAQVNLCVPATNGLSPEIGQGSGKWMNVSGAVGGLATGYCSLNFDGPCILDSVHGVSNLE